MMTATLSRCSRRRQKGFTLLELLIAIGITVITSAIGYGTLAAVQKNAREIENRLDRLTALQKTLIFLDQDFQQLIVRSARDQYGSILPALATDTSDDTYLELSRAGWRNPLGLSRSDIQRIAYRLQDNALERLHWYALDRAPESTPIVSVLADDVSEMSWRYLDKNNEWHTQWPPVSAINPVPTDIPVAVELTLILAPYGELTRLYALPQ